MKNLYKILLVAGLCGLFMSVPKQVHAQTSTYPANITVDGSSDVLINGQQTNEDYVANNDTVTVNFSNNTGSQILICSKGSSYPPILAGNSAPVSVTVNSEAELTVNLTSCNCGNGSGTPGDIFIEGATGSLNCSIVSSKVWNITGQYSHVPQSIYLTRGGILQASSGSGSYFNVTVNEEFSGQASAATYYLYDGASSSAELIGQATCPAVQTATVTTPSSSAQTPTTSSSASSTSSTPAPTTTTTSNKAKATAEKTKPTTSNAPKKISASNTSSYITGGVILLLIAALLVLNFANIWTKPRELLLQAWHKVKRTKHGHAPDDEPKA